MIQKLTWETLRTRLISAKRQIVMIIPSVHEEWFNAIKENPNLGVLKMKFCIENDEMAERSGYGKLAIVEELNNLGAELKELPRLRATFIQIDDQAYSIFIESRIISADMDCYNAIQIDEAMASSIMHQFFPITSSIPNIEGSNVQESVTDFEDNPSTGVPIHEINHSLPVRQLNYDKLQVNINNLRQNPPDPPDLKRKIQYYSTKFLFVNMSVEGMRILSSTIHVPKGLFPFKDQKILDNLNTKLKLFQPTDKKLMNKWKEIEKLPNDLRKEFLTSCSLRPTMSILHRKNKVTFENEIEQLNKKLKIETFKLVNIIQESIEQMLSRFKLELMELYRKYPPDSYSWAEPENLEKLFQRDIDRIIGQMQIPDANSLIEKLNVKCHYYDLTYHDLLDEEFLGWCWEAGIISSSDEHELAEFKTAFPSK